MDNPLQVAYAADQFCVAHSSVLIVMIWGRPVEAADLGQLSKLQHRVVQEHGHCVVLSVVRAGLSMSVEDDVREAGKQNLQEFAGVTRGSALVIESGGLRASFFRSVITGLHLLTRSQVPQKVLDEIDEGVNWLLEQPGVSADFPRGREAIIAGIHELADAYGSR